MSYRTAGKFTVFADCGHITTAKYARAHNGLCKFCHESNQADAGPILNDHRSASREEQHTRYIDCGPANWDDK